MGDWPFGIRDLTDGPGPGVTPPDLGVPVWNTSTKKFDWQALGVGTRNPMPGTGPPIVSSLPGSPVDGQMCNYLADSTNGVVWQLKYRSASSSAYKWEFVGGSALFSDVATDETTASTTYVALTTAGPSITVPLAGDYLVEFGSTQTNASSPTAASIQYHSVDVGATAATDADAARTNNAANLYSASASKRLRKTALAASTALVSKYRVSVATVTAHFLTRYMRVTPIRVG